MDYKNIRKCELNYYILLFCDCAIGFVVFKGKKFKISRY